VTPDRSDAETPVEELADDAARRNPDPTTRREAFEVDLLDRDRSEDGELLEVVSPDEAEPDAADGVG
jgi:hypothetical protein